MQKSFEELKPDVLDRAFVTLQCVMDEVLMSAGGNNYSIPHMKKVRMVKMNELPDSVKSKYVERCNGNAEASEEEEVPEESEVL